MAIFVVAVTMHSCNNCTHFLNSFYGVIMTRSMTAFDRSELQDENGRFVLELRSVNHRYLDVNLRLPEDLRSAETKIREVIAKYLSRGKVDCSVKFDPAVSVASVSIDEDLAAAVIEGCRKINTISGAKRDVDPLQILKWPGVICAQEKDIEQLNAAVISLLEKSLGNMIEAREREGASLDVIIRSRMEGITEIIADVKVRVPEVIKAVREKVMTRLNDLKIDLEENNPRLEQELVLQAQKLDVDEELDRLETHLKEIDLVLKKSGPVGRKLDFLMQELNREANTLGSKSADAETTKASVDMKVLIEQMREQIQNIE